MKRPILFTGGGSAGHVVANIALIAALKEQGYEVCYVGSYHGIERELITRQQIPYTAIATGKWRRYFSYKNFFDLFKVAFGIVQSLWVLLKLRPKLVFSKGGFVGFPVVVAAKLLRIPVIIHEADLTPGLANRLSFILASKICVSFSETLNYFRNRDKVIVTGLPLRKELFLGNAEKGLELCGFTAEKPLLLVFGGSLGAAKINQTIRALLPKILEQYNVAHVCGAHGIDNNLQFKGYCMFSYLHEEFPDLLAAASLVVARAGANTVCELIALQKPSILLPLGKEMSRGDQILNAEYSVRHGASKMILDHELTPETLWQAINSVKDHLNEMKNACQKIALPNATATITNLIMTEIGG